MSSVIEDDHEAWSCSFNAQQDHFVCKTSTGFAVYRTDPFLEKLRVDVPGGIVMAELLESTNLLAYIPCESPHEVHLWDAVSRTVVSKLRESESGSVRSIHLRLQVIVCVLQHAVEVHAYDPEIRLLHTFETSRDVSRPVCSSHRGELAVAMAAAQIGHIKVIKLAGSAEGDTVPLKTMTIAAHKSAIACLAMSMNGAVLASASTTGTLVRIWSGTNGQQLAELRRGAERASIGSLSFNVENTRLAMTSSQGTIHVFRLSNNATSVNNKVSKFAQLSPVLPYLGSSWSFTQAHLDEKADASSTAIGWVSENIFVALSNGHYWKYVIVKVVKAGKTRYRGQLEAHRVWNSETVT